MNANSIALTRIEKLLALAKKEYSKNPSISQRYVSLARKIAMKHRLKLGNKLFCKNCNTLFIFGKTVRVRVSSSKKSVVYECLICGKVKRFSYGREKARNRFK